ncbi:MAG TPA: SH3 domain-containing protein [Myxococcota bacterium]|nr:SH3 domain-containing protein [Myxococcota bacterium]HRY94352.1 SH3 domain-containing protein [Myxococcota bacterium]HSA22852.1 SH3 domain-containing protein [Myxococcota bacterium]
MRARVLRWAWWLLGLGLAGAAQAGAPAVPAAAPTQREILRPAHLRSGPALYHAVLESLPEGAEVDVLQDGQRWLEVRTASGLVGWVSARAFLAAPAPSGYGALLGKPGLPGVSAPVVTMASRALAPEGPDGLAAVGLELALSAGAPTAAEVERLAPPSGPACRQDEEPAGDPAREAGERRLGLLLGARWLDGARLVTEPAAARYLGALGLRVAERSSRFDLGWSFALVADPRPRAVGLPGGLVLLSTGLVAGLPDEVALAAALGREIARVCLGQGADELSARLAGPPPVPAARALDEAARVLLAPRGPAEDAAAAALGSRWAACAGFSPGPASADGRARFQSFLGRLPR